MIFKLINESKALRHVWSRGRQVAVAPGETKNLDLSDANAVFVRRCEKRGEKFMIEAVNDEGREVLLRAETPIDKPKRFNIIGPDGKPVPIRDEIEEDKLRELAKQPDPGMRKQPVVVDCDAAAEQVIADIADLNVVASTDQEEEEAKQPVKESASIKSIPRVRRQR